MERNKLPQYAAYSVESLEIFNVCAKRAKELEAIVDNVNSWGMDKAEIIAKRMKRKCVTFNTCQDPHLTAHLKHDVQFHILSKHEDFTQDKDALILVERHEFGCPESNYSNMFVYRSADVDDILNRIYIKPEQLQWIG